MIFSLFFYVACRSAPPPPINSAGVLQAEFWRSFQGSLGCTGIHLTTWNSTGTVGMDIQIPGIPSDRPMSQRLSIEARDAMVMVETGQEIPLNFCVDAIVEIPVQHVYHATEGTVHIEISPVDNAYYATAKLSGVLLESERGDHKIALPSLQLPDVRIGEKRSQSSSRPRIQHGPQ